MPIHWGGFTLALHPWDEPVIESRKLAAKIGLNCLTPKLEMLSSETITQESSEWWVNF